jgi:hypothetical protein
VRNLTRNKGGDQ